MLIFGHIGITLGAAVLLKSTLTRSYSLQPRGNNVLECLESIPRRHSAQNDSSSGRAGRLASLEKIDARLLLIGSLLPDIIDKPVGTFLFRESLSNGRIFCHTLAVLLFITLTGIYLYQSHGKIWLLVLSFGTFTKCGLLLKRCFGQFMAGASKGMTLPTGFKTCSMLCTPTQRYMCPNLWA